jgi:iron-sulfur cluster assembly accessory protein
MENQTPNTDSTLTQISATATAPQGGIILTAKAIEAVKKAIQEEGLSSDHGLRIAVQGGGCSGLQYALDFSNEERMGDTVLEFDGLKVFVDMASTTYLQGTEIDYLSGLNGTGFKFNNPNAKRTCGCGSSFS